MTISILVKPSQVGFRATTGGPLQLSAGADSPAKAIDAPRELIAGRLERGPILIDHAVQETTARPKLRRLARKR